MTQFLNKEGLTTVLSKLKEKFERRAWVYSDVTTSAPSVDNETSSYYFSTAYVGNYINSLINGVTAQVTTPIVFKGSFSSLPAASNYSNGNVVQVSDSLTTYEYVLVNGSWVEFGDENSFALKTVSISSTGALTGNGDYQNDITISHADTSSVSNVSLSSSTSDGTVTVPYLNSISYDKYGHITATGTANLYYYDKKLTFSYGGVAVNDNSSKDNVTTFTANQATSTSTSLSVNSGNAITVSATSGTITVSHNDTSDLSGTYPVETATDGLSYYINSITVDNYGHLTAYTQGKLSKASTSTLGLVKSGTINSTGTAIYFGIDGNSHVYTKVVDPNNGALTMYAYSSSASNATKTQVLSTTANTSSNSSVNFIGGTTSGAGTISVTVDTNKNIVLSTDATVDAKLTYYGSGKTKSNYVDDSLYGAFISAGFAAGDLNASIFS